MRNFKRRECELITEWMNPRETVETTEGMITNLQFCHEEAARQRRKGYEAYIHEDRGEIAVLHPEAGVLSD
jgi:hypothetical protein